MNATDFLSAVAGVTRAELPPGNKLATIDPAYTVGDVEDPTLPKVTFDGESTLSTKQYPILAGYVPTAGDRVVMVPVGRTYLIAGTVSHPRPLRTGARGVIASQTLTVSSAAWTTDSVTDMALDDVVVTADRTYKIGYHVHWALSALGNWNTYVQVDGIDHVRMALAQSDGTIIYGLDSASVLWTPTAGTKDLRVVVREASGAANFSFYGDATTPRMLWVEDIGPR